jgi:diguanylate cyclase (GGDEF)-like protein
LLPAHRHLRRQGEVGVTKETKEPEAVEAPLTASVADNGSPCLDERSEEWNPIAELAAAKEELAFYRQKAFLLDDKVFQMRALLQSGKGFSEILNLDALLQAFMAVCRERYGSVKSTVLLLDDLDPDNVFYRVRAFYGLPPTYVDQHGEEEELLMFKIPYNHGLLWQVIQQGEVFSVQNMRREPRFTTAFREWKLSVLESDVWVPLMRGGQVHGLLTLGVCWDGSRIPESDFTFLEEIAAVAATNIDSTLKYEKNARILANLRTLYDVNQQLANVNDFKQLSIDTLASAVEALSAQKANLMLYNAETQELEIKVVWGNIPRNTRDAINEGRMATKKFALGEGVAGRAAKHRRPVRVNDRNKIEQVGRNLVYCILSVPMNYGGEVVGVMTLTNKVKADDEGRLVLDTLGRFGEDDEQLLLGLADQAAANLHKARLYSASITDRLTGIYNARHFESRIEGAVLESLDSEKPLCLAVFDIDHFKNFNDTYGHRAGDFVLARTANMLQSSTREGRRDSVYRYGGEEFCMLLPDTTVDEAAHLVDGFRQSIESADFDFEGRRLKVTISAGLAHCPNSGSSPDTLFTAADNALYGAKNAGRNRIMVMGQGRPKAWPPGQSEKESTALPPENGQGRTDSVQPAPRN